MFPGSEIARTDEQSETKVKYLIQCGITDSVVNTLMKDFSKAPLIFKFYETITSQIKKQYDGYIQYRSAKHGKVLSAYVGSLFIGHCDHNQLVEHFVFGSKLNWDSSYLIYIGTHGSISTKNLKTSC